MGWHFYVLKEKNPLTQNAIASKNISEIFSEMKKQKLFWEEQQLREFIPSQPVNLWIGKNFKGKSAGRRKKVTRQKTGFIQRNEEHWKWINKGKINVLFSIALKYKWTSKAKIVAVHCNGLH